MGPMRSKVAPQANLWYNEDLILSSLRSVDALPRAVYNLIERLQTLDTLYPHTQNDNPQEPGVYKITCIVTKKFYIGSTVNLYWRHRDHFNKLRRNAHENAKLQNAFNKHGEGSFIFEVIELILIPELLTAREQYYLDTLKPFGRKGYNINPTAGSCLGRKMSPEAIEKTRQANLGHTRNRGKKLTPEHIERIRQASLGRKMPREAVERTRQVHLGSKRSLESRQRMSQSALGRKRSPEAIEKGRQSNLGKKRSPEAIEKARQANIGKKRSPEAIENMRQARWGKREEAI